MPQVYMVLSPKVAGAIVVLPYPENFMAVVGQKLIELTEKVFGLVGKNDVVFTTVGAVYVDRDADVQVEVRYTIGEDEYDEGRPFEPNKEQKILLTEEIITFLKIFERLKASSVSVWVIPIRDSTFCSA